MAATWVCSDCRASLPAHLDAIQAHKSEHIIEQLASALTVEMTRTAALRAHLTAVEALNTDLRRGHAEMSAKLNKVLAAHALAGSDGITVHVQ